MKEELYELYKSDPDFKEYADKFISQTGLSLDEILDLEILKNYGDYINDKNK